MRGPRDRHQTGGGQEQRNRTGLRQEQMEYLFSMAAGHGEPRRIIQICCGYSEKLTRPDRIFDPAGITGFHHAPVFDLIVFTFAPGEAPDDCLLSTLQYCRMLLRSDGRVALLLPGDSSENWYHHLFACMSFGRGFSRRCPGCSLLVSSGFADIRKQIRSGCGHVVTGQRSFTFHRHLKR